MLMNGSVLFQLNIFTRGFFIYLSAEHLPIRNIIINRQNCTSKEYEKYLEQNIKLVSYQQLLIVVLLTTLITSYYIILTMST